MRHNVSMCLPVFGALCVCYARTIPACLYTYSNARSSVANARLRSHCGHSRVRAEPSRAEYVECSAIIRSQPDKDTRLVRASTGSERSRAQVARARTKSEPLCAGRLLFRLLRCALASAWPQPRAPTGLRPSAACERQLASLDRAPTRPIRARSQLRQKTRHSRGSSSWPHVDTHEPKRSAHLGACIHRPLAVAAADGSACSSRKRSWHTSQSRAEIVGRDRAPEAARVAAEAFGGYLCRRL